jgi:transporter family protein
VLRRLDKLSVDVAANFAVLILRERPTVPNWIGIALIAAGAILIAYQAYR